MAMRGRSIAYVLGVVEPGTLRLARPAELSDELADRLGLLAPSKESLEDPLPPTDLGGHSPSVAGITEAVTGRPPAIGGPVHAAPVALDEDGCALFVSPRIDS